MAAAHRPVISASVEGPTDEAVLRRLVEWIGGELGTVYGKTGKPALLERLPAYNHAATRYPWVVLLDLDHSADCAPAAVTNWLPVRSPNMCLSVAVRAVESWLLADRENLAAFLSVPLARIPEMPETLDDPKQTMVELARHSRRRNMREDMVPRPESGRRVGPAYTSRMLEFVQNYWQPDQALARSDSLWRFDRRLRRLLVSAR